MLVHVLPGFHFGTGFLSHSQMFRHHAPPPFCSRLGCPGRPPKVCDWSSCTGPLPLARPGPITSFERGVSVALGSLKQLPFSLLKSQDQPQLTQTWRNWIRSAWRGCVVAIWAPLLLEKKHAQKRPPWESVWGAQGCVPSCNGEPLLQAAAAGLHQQRLLRYLLSGWQNRGVGCMCLCVCVLFVHAGRHALDQEIIFPDSQRGALSR